MILISFSWQRIPPQIQQANDLFHLKTTRKIETIKEHSCDNMVKSAEFLRVLLKDATLLMGVGSLLTKHFGILRSVVGGGGVKVVGDLIDRISSWQRIPL